MLLNISPSGSFAKGTANKSGTDIDLFSSISENCSDNLKELYDKMFQRMQQKGYSPKKQNVSINVKASGYDVALVPDKREQSQG